MSRITILDDSTRPKAPKIEGLDRLDRTVRSHFGYEEVELEQALGYHEVEF